MTEKIEDLTAPLEAIEANTDAVSYIRKLKNIEKSTGKAENAKGGGWGKQALNLANTFHQALINNDHFTNILRLYYDHIMAILRPYI